MNNFMHLASGRDQSVMSPINVTRYEMEDQDFSTNQKLINPPSVNKYFNNDELDQDGFQVQVLD